MASAADRDEAAPTEKHSGRKRKASDVAGGEADDAMQPQRKRARVTNGADAEVTGERKGKGRDTAPQAAAGQPSGVTSQSRNRKAQAVRAATDLAFDNLAKSEEPQHLRRKDVAAEPAAGSRADRRARKRQEDADHDTMVKSYLGKLFTAGGAGEDVQGGLAKWL